MDEAHPLLRRGTNYHENGLSGYGEFFKHCSGDSKMFLEATTHYIYQQTALDVLASKKPLPHIIFLLRDPAKRVLSSYEYSKNNLGVLAQGVSFAALVENITAGSTEFIAEHCTSAGSTYVLTNDIRYSRYIDYLDAWAERFSHENISIILFEDLVKSPRKIMTQLCDRLGIESSFYREYSFVSQNESFDVRSTLLHRGGRRLSRLIPENRIRDLLRGAYIKVQRIQRSGRLAEEDEVTLTKLARGFEPYNIRLAQEFNLDISAWEWYLDRSEHRANS